MSWRIDGTSVSKEEYDRRLLAKQGTHFEAPDRDIAYHFGIELVNDRYEIFVGRDLDQDGAHCIGMNQKAIGICFIGNFDGTRVPADQWTVGVFFVRSLCRILLIPITCVIPHRDYAQKTCPGKLFDMELFRRDLLRIT